MCEGAHMCTLEYACVYIEYVHINAINGMFAFGAVYAVSKFIVSTAVCTYFEVVSKRARSV